MPVDLVIQQFPENAPNRQFCFVWTRKKDGVKVRFGCDTQENCARMLEHFKDRAREADDKGLETM